MSYYGSYERSLSELDPTLEHAVSQCGLEHGVASGSITDLGHHGMALLQPSSLAQETVMTEKEVPEKWIQSCYEPVNRELDWQAGDSVRSDQETERYSTEIRYASSHPSNMVLHRILPVDSSRRIGEQMGARSKRSWMHRAPTTRLKDRSSKGISYRIMLLYIKAFQKDKWYSSHLNGIGRILGLLPNALDLGLYLFDFVLVASAFMVWDLGL